MDIEIERKFLVEGEFKSQAIGKFDIKQGYISTDPERTVRIRVADNKGFITIKGGSDESGMMRMEWEKEIPFDEADSLLALCHKPIIEKVRYVIESGDHVIEVDEFGGDNVGLILAEIELSDKDEIFELPDWLGKEVTNDYRYYNSYLSNHPYSKWNDDIGVCI